LSNGRLQIFLTEFFEKKNVSFDSSKIQKLVFPNDVFVIDRLVRNMLKIGNKKKVDGPKHKTLAYSSSSSNFFIHDFYA
jgi:hypothetical protein